MDSKRLKDNPQKTKQPFTLTPNFGVTCRGFTLIELLVVIAVIGLLATIVAVSVNTSRAKARDAKRIASLKQIQTALELYYDEHDDYPHYYYTYIRGSSGCGYYWCNLETDLSSYLTTLPRDPGNNYMFYEADSADNYQTYGLMAALEHDSNSDLETGDGGYYNNYYEVGPQPGYCRAKYSGSGGRWLYSYSNVCVGGN